MRSDGYVTPILPWVYLCRPVTRVVACFIQNKVPKVDVNTMEPAVWPANPAKEWCPPGHGDLYAALSGSGKLDEVRSEGIVVVVVVGGGGGGRIGCC